jgi:hypothetical protein
MKKVMELMILVKVQESSWHDRQLKMSEKEIWNTKHGKESNEICEHNEDVLQDTTIASIRHSAAAYEARGRHGQCGKTKAPTLASMVNKKVTTKDRIAERLLNS